MASSATSRFPYRRATWVVLAIAAVLRIVLIFRGGQFTQLDENRYHMSQLAAEAILRSETRKGIELALVGGDHVGFKLLGVLPALLEKGTGAGPQVPALFFGAFSVLALWLIARIARQLTGSDRAAFLALAFAASTGSLYYFSRHVLSYDASLAFMLLALHLGLGSSRPDARAVLAGVCAGIGFLVYYGYWTLGGIVLALGVLRTLDGWSVRALLAAAAKAGASLVGLAATIAAMVLFDRLWGPGTLVNGARSLSGTIVVGDFRGLRAPWEYLWYCDHLLLAFAAGAAAYGVWRMFLGPRDRRLPLSSPLGFALFGALAVQASFYLMADVLHTFAVHDRLIRQLTPFLCLAFAFGADVYLRDRRPGRRGLLAAGWLAWIGTAAWNLAVPLAQEFPEHFKVRGDALLDTREAGERPSADWYYRYVNVLHYLFEPEQLKAAPLETLLAAPHFYNYVPYLFEAKTPEDRAFRRSLDQRMRLVRMPVLPDERLSGERFGAVTMKVRFAPGRRTFLEPLLSVGSRSGGEIFFVHYLDGNVVTFGFFSWGYAVFDGPRVAIEPGRDYEITLFSSSLLSGLEADPTAVAADPALAYDHEHPGLVVELDHQRVFEHAIVPKPVLPEQVYAGVNAVQTDYALSQFSGRISDVRRTKEFPLLGTLHAKPVTLGADTLSLDIEFPERGDTHPGPIAVFGIPGRALLVYVRSFPDGKQKIGFEIWGAGAWETESLDLGGKTERLEAELGPLLPPPGSKAWGAVPRARQEELRRRVVLRCGGRTVLEVAVNPGDGIDPQGHLGVNGVGGSLVYPRFTGRIRNLTLEPLEAAPKAKAPTGSAP